MMAVRFVVHVAFRMLVVLLIIDGGLGEVF
jgi:hypothetical protein